ncbi:hypothetical protein HO173_012528 [Letharia columbiana]|uniref:Uncharacterized protein n=1 Tax=Letharia columbiana TaxID=112416 RepID=A0A8H6FFK7_9LECA|nr:uncharacterized protein HO173_012528 [Letharia columbiana]KAF6226038.1 hypothetical protein HO173_012528 [Letharia columbiana]
MRLINVCPVSALSAVLAFLTVISSATPHTPLLTRKGDDVETKREQVSLSSDGTLGPRPLAKRVDINDLVSTELGQWTMHVIKYYALVPVESAAQALESFYSNIKRQASAMSQQSAAASLPARLNSKAGNLFTANSAFFQLKIWSVAILAYIICGSSTQQEL